MLRAGAHYVADGLSDTAPILHEIQARLMDDCGKAVTDASVTASFSSGDPGLALALIDPRIRREDGTQ